MWHHYCLFQSDAPWKMINYIVPENVIYVKVVHASDHNLHYYFDLEYALIVSGIKSLQEC